MSNEERRRKDALQQIVVGVHGPPLRSHVTDHAIVRYLERYVGLDIESIKRAMLSGGRDELIASMKTGKVPISDGVKLVALKGTVITVIGPKE